MRSVFSSELAQVSGGQCNCEQAGGIMGGIAGAVTVFPVAFVSMFILGGGGAPTARAADQWYAAKVFDDIENLGFSAGYKIGATLGALFDSPKINTASVNS